MNDHQAPATRSDLNVQIGVSSRQVREALRDARLAEVHNDMMDTICELLWR